MGKQVANLAKNLVALHGLEVTRPQIRLTLAINKDTEYLSENERDKLLDSAWRKIKQLKDTKGEKE